MHTTVENREPFYQTTYKWLISHNGVMQVNDYPWKDPIANTKPYYPKFKLNSRVLTNYGILVVNGIYIDLGRMLYRFKREGLLFSLPENQVHSRWCI